jgi:hypothetical protein
VLQVDGRQGRWKLPQVRSGRTDQRAHLSETPMSGCNLLIASRHHQGKPSRIVPVRFHPKARLFNRPRLRAFRPARHRLMEVRKVQKASVIESRKPLRGYAANPLPARHIHAEVTGNRVIALGRGHHVASAGATRAECDRPSGRRRSKSGSAQARADISSVEEIDESAEDRRDRSGRRRPLPRFTPARERGWPLSRLERGSNLWAPLL